MNRAVKRRQQKLAEKAAKKMGNAQQALNVAKQHHMAGEFAQAESIYKKIIRTDPRNFEALHLYGVLSLQAGKTDIAVDLIAKAVACNPGIAEAHNNLGLALQGAGRQEDAIESYKKALEINPDYPDAHMKLGNACQALGRLEDAVESYRKAIVINPDFPEAHNNLGFALHGLGLYEEAAASYRQALALVPNYTEAHCNLGIALFKMDMLAEAEASYRQALALNPDYAEAHNNLGQVLHKLWRLDESVDSYRQALALNSAYPEVYSNLGQALKDWGKLDEALDSFQKALEIRPGYAEGHMELGSALQEVGRMEEAAESFRLALTSNPNFGDAYRLLANTKKFTEEDDDLKMMLNADAMPDLEDDQRMSLDFGLGKAFEDLQQYDKAFDYFSKANSLRRATFEFSLKKTEIHHNLMKEIFNEDLFSKHLGAGLSGDNLIFVLGLQRSGTTLVEQILSSHPNVNGIGEVDCLHQVLCTNFNLDDDTRLADSVNQADTNEFSKPAEEYLELIGRRADLQQVVVDKTLGNFMNIGFVKLMFPNAKIVHCQRSPQDTCLSIFKNSFLAGSVPYAYDLVELGRYYNLYRDLMAHWHDVLSGFVYDIQYEELVDDQEQQSRDLLAFCGLEWDDACLEFFKTKRQVKTLSIAQVRQPIYKGSVEAWKRYEKQLAPLLEVLE